MNTNPAFSDIWTIKGAIIIMSIRSIKHQPVVVLNESACFAFRKT
jgi:hypothetical protein